jgi:hypothetical protein
MASSPVFSSQPPPGLAVAAAAHSTPTVSASEPLTALVVGLGLLAARHIQRRRRN